jgi:hypothetical protein
MTRMASFIRAFSVSKDISRGYSSKKGKNFVKNEAKQIVNSKVYKKSYINYQDTIGKAYAKQLNENNVKNIKYVTQDQYFRDIDEDEWFTKKANEHAFKN